MADLKVNQMVRLDGEDTWVILRHPTGAQCEYTFANGKKLVGDPQGWMDQGRLVLLDGSSSFEVEPEEDEFLNDESDNDSWESEYGEDRLD